MKGTQQISRVQDKKTRNTLHIRHQEITTNSKEANNNMRLRLFLFTFHVDIVFITDIFTHQF